jgi:hypothetical protein
MYSLSGRLNTIAFNTLITLGVLSALNYLSCYPFPFLGDLESRLPKIITPFKIRDFDTFVKDNFINENALSFTFDFGADFKTFVQLEHEHHFRVPLLRIQYN